MLSVGRTCEHNPALQGNKWTMAGGLPRHLKEGPWVGRRKSEEEEEMQMARVQIQLLVSAFSILDFRRADLLFGADLTQLVAAGEREVKAGSTTDSELFSSP